MRNKLQSAATSLLLLLTPLAAAAHNVLLAPGDIDADGDVDLVRIEEDGTAHIVDTNGGRQTFQTMNPDRQDLRDAGHEPATPQVTGALVLPDTNSNGSREILVYGHDAWSYLFAGSGRWQATEAWDPATTTRLWADGTSVPVIPELIWDQTGDQVADLARRDARPAFPLIHGVTDSVTGIRQTFPGSSADGSFNFSWRFEAVAALFNIHGIGILGQGKDGAGDMIEFRDPETHAITQKIWAGIADVRQAESIVSLDDNRTREWVVLWTASENQNPGTGVVIFDGLTGDRIRGFTYTGLADPLKLMVVNGTDLALVSRFGEDGAEPLEVRDARTGNRRLRVWYPKTLHIESITRTPDMNANGFQEVAVIGEWPNGTHSILIRDSRTGADVDRIWFPD